MSNKQILKNMKNQKKQTAVEWLEQEMLKPYLSMKEILKQAKEMEKKQMIGLLQWMNRVTQSDPMRLETDDDDVVEQYYLETFNTKEK